MDYEDSGEKPGVHIEIEAPYQHVAGSLALDFADIGTDLPFRASTVDTIQRIALECPEVEPRIEQMECLDALEEARESGKKTALVQMATGLGKTTVIAADAKRFLEVSPDSRILFLCHQNRILDQARERFERIIGSEASYGTFTGESQDYHEVTCLFASFQAMSNWREAFLPDEFDYIVVDESHHAKAPSYEPTLHHFQPQFMAGFTGTPDRKDLQNIREIFGAEVYEKQLDEAIAEGILTAADYKVVTDEVTDENILKDIKDRKHNIKQLNRTIFAPLRDKEIARLCIEDAEELDTDVRRLVFCTSIEHAEEFAQYFPNAAPVHSGLPAWEVKRTMEDFRSGKINTLLTIDMFNEGIDIPHINQIVFVRQTSSKTVFLQQLGRGLRKVPGKNVVQVRDFVANCDRLAMIDEFWQQVTTTQADEENEYREIERVEIGGVHFTPAQREILDILAEIEINNAVAMRWSPDQSMEYYTSLCANAGKLLSLNEFAEAIQETPETPSLRVILAPFDHSLNKLREAIGLTQPFQEGYSTASNLSNLLGINRTTVVSLAERLGIPGVRMTKGRQIGVHYSPKEQGRMIQLWELTPAAPEEYIALTPLQKRLGIATKTLANLISKLELEPQIMRGPTNYGKYLSPEHQQLILDEWNSTPEVEDDLLTANAIAKLLGMSLPTAKKYIEISRVEGVEGRRSDGRIGRFYNLEEVQKIKEEWDRTPSPPDASWIAANQLGKDLGTNSATIIRTAEKLGLSFQVMRSQGRQGYYYSSEDQEKIREAWLAIPEAPEGFVTAERLAETAGIPRSTVNGISKQLGISGQRMRKQAGRRSIRQGIFFSPKECEQILNYFNNMPLAQEDWLTSVQLEKKLRIHSDTLRKAISELGIARIKARTEDRRISRALYVIPEQAERIRVYVQETAQ